MVSLNFLFPFLAGITGLQWAKHLRGAVRVVINDISDVCVKMIKENCKLNDIRVEGGPRTPRGPDGANCDASKGAPPTATTTSTIGSGCATVEVTKMDANVIMHLRGFDYMWVQGEAENTAAWLVGYVYIQFVCNNLCNIAAATFLTCR